MIKKKEKNYLQSSREETKIDLVSMAPVTSQTKLCVLFYSDILCSNWAMLKFY